MTGTMQLDGLGAAAGAGSVKGVLWGIDPSTLRVSVGVRAGTSCTAHTLSLPSRKGFQKDERRELEWHATVCHDLMHFFGRLAGAEGVPRTVRLEEPFGGRDGKGKGKTIMPRPSTHRAFGVVLAALGLALGPAPVDFCSPPEWKARALGKGHGFAQKDEIMEWAQRTFGYAGSLEDEADAIGIAESLAVDLA